MFPNLFSPYLVKQGVFVLLTVLFFFFSLSIIYNKACKMENKNMSSKVLENECSWLISLLLNNMGFWNVLPEKEYIEFLFLLVH